MPPDPGKGKTRPARGGPRQGAGRKPKELNALREKLRDHFPACLKEIARLSKQSKDDRVRYDACKWIAEQTIGKAMVRVDHTGESGEAPPILAVIGLNPGDL